MEGKSKKLDGVSGAKAEQAVPEGVGPGKASEKTDKIKVTVGKIPHRGTAWYILFIFFFVALSAFSIYFEEWFIIFFIFVFFVGTLWRGHMVSSFEVLFGEDSFTANGKEYYYENIESYYFSRYGDELTLNFIFLKKYLPKMSFMLADSKDGEIARRKLSEEVPETHPQEERWVDLIIRKLKI